MVYKKSIDYSILYPCFSSGGSGSWLTYTMIPFALYMLDEMEATLSFGDVSSLKDVPP